MKIDSFLSSVAAASGSKHTQRAYRQPLGRFEEFLRERGLRVDQVVCGHIVEWINYLKHNTGRIKGETLAPASINLYLTAVSMYFDWRSAELGGRAQNPVRLIKRPRVRNKDPKPVDEAILTKLIEGITDLRDLALILLLLGSGLRLAEAWQLDRNAFSLRKHQLTDGAYEYYGIATITGKGNKEREIIVAPPAMLAIRNYIKTARATDTLPPLFLSSRKIRLSCRAIEQILAKWCDRLGIDHIHPHRLRHSFATRNVNAGMSLPVLARLLGHGSIAVTERYTKISIAKMQREYYAAMEYVSENQAA